MKITPDLCIAARNLLRLTRPQLAEQAGVAAVTLKLFEDGVRATAATEAKLAEAFDAHGVTFKTGAPSSRSPARRHPLLSNKENTP